MEDLAARLAILAYFEEHHEQWLSSKDLAVAIALDESTAERLVKDLARMGTVATRGTGHARQYRFIIPATSQETPRQTH